MSTTTEARGFVTAAIRLAGAAVLVVGLWFAGLALLLLVVEPTRRVVVLGPSESAFKAAIVSSALAVDGGRAHVIAHGQRRGFVRELYAAGAWLVLPATGGGCRGRPAGT